MMEATEILTIGHSSHALEAFIPLLQQNGITAVADVRSSPYSRHNSEFNRESLKQALNQHGIAYSFLGSELGGRPKDTSCYGEEGQVRFELLAKTEQFRRGIERVMEGGGEVPTRADVRRARSHSLPQDDPHSARPPAARCDGAAHPFGWNPGASRQVC